jgi:hypothetical protein
MDDSAGIKLLAAIIGFWIIMRAVNKDASGRTLVDHLLGQSGGANQPIPVNAAGAPASGILGAVAGAAASVKGVNPIPGSTGGRLDQGFDVTGKSFVAPYSGTVVASEITDPGWRGGGYVAIQSAANPNRIEYFAEGLLPIVSKGQTVLAGQAIAQPAVNPYNAIIGNIETGPANPRNPLQPLAQVVSNPTGAVNSFYSWLRGLGAPAASSTSSAGHA